MDFIAWNIASDDFTENTIRHSFFSEGNKKWNGILAKKRFCRLYPKNTKFKFYNLAIFYTLGKPISHCFSGSGNKHWFLSFASR